MKTSDLRRGFLFARGGAEGRRAASPPAVKIKKDAVASFLSSPPEGVRQHGAAARSLSRPSPLAFGRS